MRMEIELQDITNGVLLSWKFGGMYDEGDRFFKTRKEATEAAKRRLDSYVRGEHD